jgi:hypothetical protein
MLELLKEIAPRVQRAGVIRDATSPSGPAQFAAIQAVAPSVGVEVSPIGIRDAGDIDQAIAAFARSSSEGIIVTGSALAAVHQPLGVGGGKPTRPYPAAKPTIRAIIPEVIAAPRRRLRAWHRALAPVAPVRERPFPNSSDRLRERGEGAISPDHGINIAEARLNSADRIAARKHDRAARMALLRQARVIGLRCHRRTTCSVACTSSCQTMTHAKSRVLIRSPARHLARCSAASPSSTAKTARRIA